MDAHQTILLSDLKHAYWEGRVKDFNRISGVLQRDAKITLDQINKIKSNVDLIKARSHDEKLI